MLLPEDLLNDVHYYHLDCDNKTFIDTITLYFTPWYKIRKKFSFHRFAQIDPNDMITVFVASAELIELIRQLREHLFGEFEEDTDDFELLTREGNVVYLNKEDSDATGSPPDGN